jgi:hypothetical protein
MREPSGGLAEGDLEMYVASPHRRKAHRQGHAQRSGLSELEAFHFGTLQMLYVAVLRDSVKLIRQWFGLAGDHWSEQSFITQTGCFEQVSQTVLQQVADAAWTLVSPLKYGELTVPNSLSPSSLRALPVRRVASKISRCARRNAAFVTVTSSSVSSVWSPRAHR